MECRKRDEVVFVVGVEMEESVADLFDVDCSRERSFLGVVAF